MTQPPNEGARLLRLAMLARVLSHDDVERLIGGGSIFRYLTGREPALRFAVALERELGIPVAAWLKPPTSTRSSRHADGVSAGLARASTRSNVQVSR